MMNATTLRNFTYPLEAMSLLRLARFTLLPILALSGLALGMGTARADDLLITNGTSSNFSSGNNSYGAISVGTSEGVVDGNNLTVVNTNTVVASTGDLTVGGTGSGNSLTISSGGSVAADNMLWLGQSAGSDSNSVVVTGTGSSLGVWSLAIGDRMTSGNTGNTLEVSAGGSLTSGNTDMFGSSNAVLVTGSGSTWTNSGMIAVGSGAMMGGSSVGNSLVISNGGKVASGVGAWGGELLIGVSGNNNQNSVTVTGAGSLLTNGGDLYVGYYGSSNSLVVSGGGTVANANGFIGNQSTDNTALVTGAGSLWTNSGTLTVGGSPWSGAAGGTLTVASGGTVAAAGGITLATQAGDTGTLNIGRFGTNDAAGTIVAPTIAFGNGTGVINFNQSNSTTVSAAISGNGTVNQLGNGTTTLSGANTYSGTTTVYAGTLLANNTTGSGVGTSAVTVNSGGTLGGNGTIGGATTIASGGKLTPGSSGAGVLSFSNGLTLESGSITTFLINSTGDFTSINILGNTINYGGNLVFNMASYTPAAGDAFTLFNMTAGATQSGGFSSVTAGSLIFTESSGTWSASYGAYDYQFSQSTGQLSVAANLQEVPEPSTYALLGLGALALLIAYRRKRRKVA